MFFGAFCRAFKLNDDYDAPLRILKKHYRGEDYNIEVILVI